MSDSSRDERLTALEAAVKSAESKLKSAEISAEEIGKKLKSSEDSFSEQLAEKSESYKKQTGAELVRKSDENTGKVTYDFVREATDNEKKKKQKIVFKRVYDESGKYKLKPQIILDDDDKTVTVTSVKDLKKPKERKRYIATKVFGHYGKIEFSTKVNNPFLKTVGKPIIVPVRAAVKLTEKIGNAAGKLVESSVGKGVSKAAKIVSPPIVIPAKVVKDIADKGGVIHYVVDLGDKIRIEGNLPKPLKISADIAIGTALGIETGTVNAVKNTGNFSIELAKRQIADEINKGISENEASQAAYVIGMKMVDVYKILDEHSRYKRAVKRDKAGSDITDENVSKYLAEKEEKKFQRKQDKLSEKKSAADYNVRSARAEYEAAKKRLENYKKSVFEMSENGENSKPQNTSKKQSTEKREIKPKAETVPSSEAKADILTKTDKKIEKVKRKLTLNQNHKYKVKFRREAVVSKDGQAKMKLRPVVSRENIPDYTPATAWNTAKKLDGYAVNTGLQSMRRKAMRDSGDNTAVEAADFAVTAAQKANRAVKYFDGKERAFKEKMLNRKLTKLENQKKIESALKEAPDQKAKPKRDDRKKSPKKQNKANQNKLLQKKRQQKLVHSNLAEKSKKAVKNKIQELAGYALKRSGGIIVIIILGLLVPIMFPVIGFSGSGVTGGMENFIGNAVSPCDTNDLSLSDRYYTELAKDLIEKHRNIRDYYTGYDKYTCLTEIDKLDHSAQKLLPFLAVSAMSVNGSDSWDFETAKPFAESLFEQQFELYINEIYEVRKDVTDTSQTDWDGSYFSLGESYFSLGDTVYYSSDYTGNAHTYTPITVPVASGYDENTLDCIGRYTDRDGCTNEYDEAQTIKFYNYWELNLIFEMPDGADTYIEHWEYTYEYQDCYEYDYTTLEYAIREKDVSVDDSYWTDTDSDWQDNTFDKLIYKQYQDMSNEDKELFDNYYNFFMGHQVFDMPFENPEISKYAGYNTEINGDLSLDQSFELKTYSGQEIISGMDGDITLIDTGFYIYNAKYGTIYYDGAASPDVSKAKQGEVISSSTGDVLRITYIDNEGNYVNPLFVFS